MNGKRSLMDRKKKKIFTELRSKIFRRRGFAFYLPTNYLLSDFLPFRNEQSDDGARSKLRQPFLPPANLFSLMHEFFSLLLLVETIFGAKRDEKTH